MFIVLHFGEQCGKCQYVLWLPKESFWHFASVNLIDKVRKFELEVLKFFGKLLPEVDLRYHCESAPLSARGKSNSVGLYNFVLLSSPCFLGSLILLRKNIMIL